MITELLAGLGTGMAYGGVGTEFARRDLPANWARARHRYGFNWDLHDSQVRHQVTLRALAVIAFWPALVTRRRISTAGHWISRHWGQFIDAGDPEQHKPPLRDLRNATWMNEIGMPPPPAPHSPPPPAQPLPPPPDVVREAIVPLERGRPYREQPAIPDPWWTDEGPR